MRDLHTPATPPSTRSHNWRAVVAFLDGASVFALSKMWSDLIATFAFGLHPIPFCGGFLESPCTPEASSERLTMYALGCVLLAALAKHLAESRLGHLPPSDPRHAVVGMVQTMTSYFVGWAVGSVFLQKLREIAADNPHLCAGDAGCVPLSFAYSLACTLGAAVVIIGLQPYTQSVECGDGELIDWLEDWLEDTWSLVVRGAASTSMILWYHTASSLRKTGVEDATPFGQLTLLVCLTLTFFFIGALLSVKLEAAEERMRLYNERHPHSPWFAQIGAAIRYSDVLQNLLAFVTGCLFTDIVTTVFSSLNEAPTMGTFVANVGVSGLFTLLCSIYLARSDDHAMSADREDVEAFFLVNSASFFVGWMWLVVARDLVTMLGVVLRWMASPFGVTGANDNVVQFIALLLGAPVCTVGVFWMQLRMQARLGEATAGPTARLAQDKEAMRKERELRAEARANRHHERLEGPGATSAGAPTAP